MTTIAFDPLHPGVAPPTRATAHSAGFDLRAHFTDAPVRVATATGVAGREATAGEDGIRRLTLAPGEKALVPLGFRARLPEGYEAQVRPRSGLSFKTGLAIPNSPGTIDADYPDEWCVPVWNSGAVPIVVGHGERIAQVVLARFEVLSWSPAAVRATTDRQGGFGSTG